MNYQDKQSGGQMQVSYAQAGNLGNPIAKERPRILGQIEEADRIIDQIFEAVHRSNNALMRTLDPEPQGVGSASPPSPEPISIEAKMRSLLHRLGVLHGLACDVANGFDRAL